MCIRTSIWLLIIIIRVTILPCDFNYSVNCYHNVNVNFHYCNIGFGLLSLRQLLSSSNAHDNVLAS